MKKCRMLILFVSVIVFSSCGGYPQLSNNRITKDLNKNLDTLVIDNEDIVQIIEVYNLEQTMIPDADGGVYYAGYADVKYINYDGIEVAKTLHWTANYIYLLGYKNNDRKNKYVMKVAYISSEYIEKEN